LEFKDDNVTVIPCSGTLDHRWTGAISINIMNLQVKNLTKSAKTLKDIKLKFEFENNEYILQSIVLPQQSIGTLKSAFFMVSGRDTVVGDWNNLRPEIYKYNPILPDGILAGDVTYILIKMTEDDNIAPNDQVFLKMEDLSKIHNIEFLIIDSRNKIYRQKFSIKDRFLFGYRKQFKLGV
jgi:hypothetical protein